MIRNYALIFMLLVLGCSGCTEGSSVKQHTGKVLVEPNLRLPEVPMVIGSEREAARFLAPRFWDSFDFADTTFLHSQKVEAWFVDYLRVLRIGNCDGDVTTRLLTRIEQTNPAWISRFMAFADQYLADANSTFRNEELYIPFATYAIRSRALDGYVKVRYQQRLALALKNRVGSAATDFPFYTTSGRKRQLSDLANQKVLLFFNNPTCHECQAIKQQLLESDALRQLIRAKKLTLLSVYIDRDMEEWKAASYPSEWLNSSDQGWITEHESYNLDAIPTIYLLDEEQRVVLKDATPQEIERVLAAPLL